MSEPVAAAIPAPELAPFSAHYPPWARDLAARYFSRTACLFILHGNVHDPIGVPTPSGTNYISLPDFLATQLFGSWDVVLHHDLGRGIRPLPGANRTRLQQMVQKLTPVAGPLPWPREPEQMLPWLEQTLERNLLIESAGGPLDIALVLEYAQYLLPAGDLAQVSGPVAARLVRFLGWAQNPYFRRVNVAFCLIADKLNEVNERLVQNPHVASIEIPLPDLAERTRFVETTAAEVGPQTLGEFTPGKLAQVANGLNLTSLQLVLHQAHHAKTTVTGDRFRELKKELLERQCAGLLQFVEPKHTLDLVVGHQAAITRLKEDAQLLTAGDLDAAPMGYLLCGPVGTGKTFLAECYAGSVGIPCVTLKNFRSKYVGETEGNLERVLSVLRSLGPVVVVIDEADAALGTRQADGDSGTSGRVFSMIASQMGDTRYRGKIVWMLLTSRPDRLPIDLKRQGRAEVHIPLFYPHEPAEIGQMFVAMAKKNKVPLAPDSVPQTGFIGQLSGADIESVVLTARRQSLRAGHPTVTAADLQTALDQFIPSAQGLEKESQEIAAVLECTQLDFLPPAWRDRVQQPNGRPQLQERLSALQEMVRR